jgi:hypothetical protein
VTPVAAKGYAWVPASQLAAKDIMSKVDLSNIIKGSPHKDKNFPELNVILDEEFPDIDLTETVTINDAMNDHGLETVWSDAMASEFDSLQMKDTGLLVPPPEDDKIIGRMWLVTRKKNEFNKVVRHKALWVVFGNHQEHMIHYFETYSSVARNESLKMMLSLEVNHRYAVFQFDVKTAFLYVNINANIYVLQVLGFEHLDPKKKSWVWKLQKLLYGTKQAPCK